MNNVSLLGRLTKDVDLKFAAGSGTAVASFTLAVNRPFKKNETDFINCKAFAKTAEILAQYVFKGQQLGVTGHIQTGKYKNKEGKDVYTTEVIVNSFDFISQSNKEQAKKDNSLEGLEEIEVLDEGEIPF
jgi:single-strand DNA-binding protein